jgi:hypothetical protein
VFGAEFNFGFGAYHMGFAPADSGMSLYQTLKKEETNYGKNYI